MVTRTRINITLYMLPVLLRFSSSVWKWYITT